MKITRHWAVFIAILILAVPVLLVVLNWIKLSGLFRIIILSIIFAYILSPMCDLVEKKMARTYAILLIYFIMAAFLFLFFTFFIPSFINEVVVMAQKFPLLMQSIRDFLLKIQLNMDDMGIPAALRDSLIAYADIFQERVTALVISLLERLVNGISGLPSMILVPVLSFYFLKDREYFASVFMNLLPLKPRKNMLKISSEINHILHMFIRGEVVVAAVVAVLATLGYFIVGLPYALVLGFIAGIFEFIPYFGPWLGAVPAVVIAYINGTGKLLWTVLLIILIQQAESIFITPRIVGDAVDLHPVYIILALWTGGMFFGVAGMFFAVPSVLILRVVLKHIYLSIVSAK